MTFSHGPKYPLKKQILDLTDLASEVEKCTRSEATIRLTALPSSGLECETSQSFCYDSHSVIET